MNSYDGPPGIPPTYFHQLPKTDKLISLHLPKKMFIWFYSFSLLIFTLLTLAFAAVTPIDVIIKTLGSSSSGIKLFIVIIVCVVFLVLSLFLYLLRLYQNRVSLNEIPSKSVYIPERTDMPNRVYDQVEQKLSLCLLDTKRRAGPLHTNNIINHAGMAPPDYIQNRNTRLGSEGQIFPPGAYYEDILRSVGDKFRLNRNLNIPQHCSFREVVLWLSHAVKNNIRKEDMPLFKRLVELYEQFKFSGDLIEEKDMLEFMIELDKFLVLFQGDMTHTPASTPRKLSSSSIATVGAKSKSYPINFEESVLNFEPSVEDIPMTLEEPEKSVERRGSWTGSILQRLKINNSSTSSTGSVIKKTHSTEDPENIHTFRLSARNNPSKSGIGLTLADVNIRKLRSPERARLMSPRKFPDLD